MWVRIKYKRVIFALVVLCYVALKICPLPIDLKQNESTRQIVDRQGRLLREINASEAGHKQWVGLPDISPEMILATLFTEDRYFYYHPGFNPVSLLRAFIHNWSLGHIVSGGSSITQQLARILLKRQRRTYWQKIKELGLALLLEIKFTKDEILEMYLNQAPYGNELYGVAIASKQYFRKTAGDLSFGEALYLTGLVKAPSFYNPYLYPLRAKSRYEKLLRQYSRLNDSSKLKAQTTIYPSLFSKSSHYLAPHFVDYVLNHENLDWQGHILKTSLDLQLQTEVESMVKNEVDRLADKGVTQAAVLVLDTKTREILAWVGSKDYWDNATQGQFNAVLAHRQPGSALKPFTYSLYFENGGNPIDIIPDIKTGFESPQGIYEPQNYDHQFHGPVRARVALASSLNVPAVKVLEKLGVTRLYLLLKKLGFEGLTEAVSYYGLGLTLGNAEVSLIELTPAYSLFANRGFYKEATFYPVSDSNKIEGEKIFSDETAFMIRDILTDDAARALSFGVDGPLNFNFPVLTKTGTSSNHRDNWAFGVTPEYSVGVWVGNFPGGPMKGVTGVSGAAPLMHKILLAALKGHIPQWGWPPAALSKIEFCPLSGQLKNNHCSHGILEYSKTKEDLKTCDYHREFLVDKRNLGFATLPCEDRFLEKRVYAVYPALYSQWSHEQGLDIWPRQESSYCPSKHPFVSDNQNLIISPAEGAVFKLDPTIPHSYQTLSFQAAGQSVSRQWFLDGQVLKEVDGKVQWVLIKGAHHLVMKDGESIIERNFEVK